MKYKVGIHCICWQQAPYIGQALESFARQKADFPFAAYVSDDGSTDGTQDVIRECARRWPDVIVPVLHRENRGIVENLVSTARMIDAEYVCFCEGDDYWTDERKLQKQADFMDAHRDVSVCFHPVLCRHEDGRGEDHVFPSEKWLKGRRRFGFEDLLAENFIQTNSVMYRWDIAGEALEDLPRDMLPCDWYMHLVHASKGGIAMLDEVMAVYRLWGGGVWHGAGSDDWLLRCGERHIAFFRQVQERFGRDTGERREAMYRAMLEAYRRREFSTALLGRRPVQYALMAAMLFSRGLSWKEKRRFFRQVRRHGL